MPSNTPNERFVRKPENGASVNEWRRLCREIPRLGWSERIAKALDAACDELEKRDATILVLRKRLANAEDFMRPKG